MPLHTQPKSISQQQPTPTHHQCHISFHINRELRQEQPPAHSQHSKAQEATKDAGPNSYAIHIAASHSARIEADRNNPSQAPRATILEELRPQCQVQDLLDGGLLGFQDQGSNVQNNPLPAHKGVAINVISHENKDETEGANRREGEENAAGCTTDSASWMEEGTHLSRLREAEFASVAYIEGNCNPRPKPLIIYYNSASKPRVPFIIQVLAKPVYNNNTISWRYLTGETTTSPTMKDGLAPKVTNIARTGGVTRSGRIFVPKSLRNKDPMHTKKDKASEALRRI
ncbi:hypothetical protein CR513_33296, partial [Mucuna pruriens]